MEKKDHEDDHDEFNEFSQNLPKVYVSQDLLVQHRGFWFCDLFLRGAITFHDHFKAHDSDIIVATMPKSGTTWLKALTFSIVNRNKYPISNSPLLFKNPHELVPFLELDVYRGGKINPDCTILKSSSIIIAGQRSIFATHLPYQCLPNTVLDGSGCRLIYLCRNPLDLFTSTVHFLWQNGLFPTESQPDVQQMVINQYFEKFCEGTIQYGPFWDHIIGYWNGSLKDTNKVLFLKYEDLKKDIHSSVKKLAEFLGCPFSYQEVNGGLVEGIAKLCSLENLKNLECNKNGELQTVYKIKNSSFFRKGEVGGWVNLLTPSMAERLESLMKKKFAETSLTMSTHV